MSFVQYEDVDESHGLFVKTRGIHQLQLPPLSRIAKYLITNDLYMEFVKATGYEGDEFWTAPLSARKRFLTATGRLWDKPVGPTQRLGLTEKLSTPLVESPSLKRKPSYDLLT